MKKQPYGMDPEITENMVAMLDALAKAKVPAGPVLAPQQLLDDPHVNQAGYFNKVSYPGLDRPATIMTTPVVLSETPGQLYQPPPVLGQHTEELLTEIGVTAKEIEALRSEGVI